MAGILPSWAHLNTLVTHYALPNSRSTESEELSAFARQVGLLSSLLSAGLTPPTALAHAGLTMEECRAQPPHSPQALFSQLWDYAMESGASLRTTLQGFSIAIEDAAENSRQARAQLAGPQAATRLVMALPIVAVLGGVVAGYDPVSFLLGQPLGWAMLVLAALLMWIAHRWSQRLVNRVHRTSWAVGMPAVAMAAALASGNSLAAALAWAQNIATGFLEPREAEIEIEGVREYERLATETGVALAELLHASARYLRAQSVVASKADIDKLGITLLIPLGVCVLPAFIAVGIIPLVVSVISSTSVF